MSADESDRQPVDAGREASGGAASPQGGVLGNLPRSRPAVRSPRRKEVRDPVAAGGADAQPAAAAGEASAAGAGGSPAAELEALARGGLAVAGEAASLGLRLAGRTAAALRDAVERR